MLQAFTIANSSSIARGFVSACALLVALTLATGRAEAQGRDGLVNGTMIGAAVGAGIGVAFTYAVRDSDLTAGQYARSALIFGAIGAGAGLGVDALLNRAAAGPAKPRRIVIAPAVWRGVAGVSVKWNW